MHWWVPFSLNAPWRRNRVAAILNNSKKHIKNSFFAATRFFLTPYFSPPPFGCWITWLECVILLSMPADETGITYYYYVYKLMSSRIVSLLDISWTKQEIAVDGAAAGLYIKYNRSAAPFSPFSVLVHEQLITLTFVLFLLLLLSCSIVVVVWTTTSYVGQQAKGFINGIVCPFSIGKKKLVWRSQYRSRSLTLIRYIVVSWTVDFLFLLSLSIDWLI